MSDSFISSIPLRNFAQHMLPRIPVKTLEIIGQAIGWGSKIAHCALIERDMLDGVHLLNLARHQQEGLEATAEYIGNGWNIEIPSTWERLSWAPYGLAIATSFLSKETSPVLKSIFVFPQKKILLLCQAASIATAVKQILHKEYTSGCLMVACMVAGLAARNLWIPKQYGDLIDAGCGVISNVCEVYSGTTFNRSLAAIRLLDLILQYIPHTKYDPSEAVSNEIDGRHLIAPREIPKFNVEYTELSDWFAEWKNSSNRDMTLLRKLASENENWKQYHADQTDDQLIAYVESGLNGFVDHIKNANTSATQRAKAAFCIQSMSAKSETYEDRLEKMFLFGLGNKYCPEGVDNEVDLLFTKCGGTLSSIPNFLQQERGFILESFIARIYEKMSLKGYVSLPAILKEPPAWIEKNKITAFLAIWIQAAHSWSVAQLVFGHPTDPHKLNLFKDLIGHRFFLHDVKEASESLPVEHRSGPIWKAIWEVIFHLLGLNAAQHFSVNYTKKMILEVSQTIQYDPTKVDQNTRDKWLSWVNEDREAKVEAEDLCTDDTYRHLKPEYNQIIANRELLEEHVLRAL